MSMNKVNNKSPKKGTGLVLQIHRMARHDGPGFRTLVCMKGCPLKCLWCSTPESQNSGPEVFINEINCTGCGKCVQVCEKGARTLEGIDRELCDNCGDCADACIYDALEIKGTPMTVDALFKEIEKDSVGYRRSGGGVTIGGGELTMQPDFVTAVLSRCRRVFYQTAIETCGFTKWENLEKILSQVKLLYYDIKHMDDVQHKKITNVSNRIILENAEKAAKICPMIIRLPVVPGLNDSKENIEATARFALGLGENVQRLELLPYHNLGAVSYGRLGLEYPLPDAVPHTPDQLEEMKKWAQDCGIRVQIGG